ncbi:MAG: hypothetical protein GXP49_10155 [Deltaproteobacteria bacterium]|nr:hypothetical protein [Deltaproteobacteria bacterium]
MTIVLNILFTLLTVTVFVMMCKKQDDKGARFDVRDIPPAGEYFNFQMALFWWVAAAAAVTRMLTYHYQSLGLSYMVIFLFLLGITIHLTQHERAKKDKAGKAMKPVINKFVSAAYLLGAGWWYSISLHSGNTSPASVAAMITLSMPVFGALMFFAVTGLKLSKASPRPWGILALVLTLVSIVRVLAE